MTDPADETARLRAEVDEARQELAAVREELRMTQLVLARKCVDLAVATAKIRISDSVIERLI